MQELLAQSSFDKLKEGAIVPGIVTEIRQNEVVVDIGGKAEGIIPAPESNHAIRAAIDEALRCKATGEAKTILLNLTGHGHFDMSSYDRYFAGELEDFDYPEEAIKASLQHLPKFA